MPKKKRAKSPFEKAASLEAAFGRDLRAIAREIGRITELYDEDDPLSVSRLTDALRKYAQILKPWAEAKTGVLIANLNRQDAVAWERATKGMSLALREELGRFKTGALFDDLQREQVELITSLPIKAAERVHDLTAENLMAGRRASEIAEEIKRTGEVTASRATMIARTEVSRASSNLTQARAEYVGSNGYIWRTSKDGDVRHSHKKMDGEFVLWDNPPTLDGLTGHAGCLPNCRCYPEPNIPEGDFKK